MWTGWGGEGGREEAAVRGRGSTPRPRSHSERHEDHAGAVAAVLGGPSVGASGREGWLVGTVSAPGQGPLGARGVHVCAGRVAAPEEASEGAVGR